MTTVVGLVCCDGLVIGTDMKVTAGNRKWAEAKLIAEPCLGKRNLIIAGAGSLRHVQDAIAWLQLERVQERLGDDPSFDEFLARVVESALPRFREDYFGKYGEEPELELLIGSVDKDGTPRLVDVYHDGNYDYKTTFAAIGSGSIFGEILLRKLYNPEITVQAAKRLVGYIIWEVQGIDNDSGEGMEIAVLGRSGEIELVQPIEVEVFKYLPILVEGVYHELRQKLQGLPLDKVKEQIEALQRTLASITQEEQQGIEGEDDGEANQRTT